MHIFITKCVCNTYRADYLNWGREMAEPDLICTCGTHQSCELTCLLPGPAERVAYQIC